MRDEWQGTCGCESCCGLPGKHFTPDTTKAWRLRYDRMIFGRIGFSADSTNLSALGDVGAGDDAKTQAPKPCQRSTCCARSR